MSKVIDSHNGADSVGRREWGKGVFFGTLTVVLLIGIAVLFGRYWLEGIYQRTFEKTPMQGTVHVFQFDYYYEPRHLTWRVGDHVTLAIRNMSSTHWHEMVIGQGFDTVPTTFGPIPTQFKRDFWDGVPVTISDATHIDNLVLNHAKATFVGPNPIWLQAEILVRQYSRVDRLI